jgi:TLC domain
MAHRRTSGRVVAIAKDEKDMVGHDGESSSQQQQRPVLVPPPLQPPRRRGPLQRFRIRRARSAPPAPGGRRRNKLLEEHFRVDADKRTVLPGVPKHDPDWNRDAHDFFNLVVLVPVLALNVMNWNWDIILNMPKNKTVSDAWTGEWFDLFFQATALYFLIDLAWILIIPSCVKSPSTILQHHVAAMLYILVPYYYKEYQWAMGACMSVELNTWFLIARRVFNKQGFPPWIIDLSFVSIRVKIISTLFYVTWIAIRCLLYPYLLPRFVKLWLNHSAAVGTKFNVVFISVPLHAAFCLLNLKWSYDLLVSKIRYWRRLKTGGGNNSNKDYKNGVSKGL